MTLLKEHSFVVFVYDKHGNPIPDAAVEVTLEGEPIAGASTIGDPSSPIHVHLSADVTVVGLRAIAGGVTKEVTVDVDVGNFTFAFPEVEVSSPPSRSNVPPAPWVLTLHGILTRGAWQKQLSSYLNASGAKHEALDYGWFDAISFLIPAIRRRQVQWFVDQYSAFVEKKERSDRPSIIAHSFGTYLLSEALDKYREIKFDRVILCGSIVRTDYPWTERFQGDQLRRLLLDFGRKDIWARLAAWVVRDAGQSGFRGFDDTAGGRVVLLERHGFGHSDYFFPLNYSANWIPFLFGTDPASIPGRARRARNWRFWLTMILLLALALVLVKLLT